jgi:hypothetical protein
LSFFDDVALRAAEELEARLGPFVALASYKRLLGGPDPMRSQAALGALRCAIALDDDRELEPLLELWPSCSGADASAHELALQLVRRGKPVLGGRLADAEDARKPDCRAAFVAAVAHAATVPPAQAFRHWDELCARASERGETHWFAHAAARAVRCAFVAAESEPGGELPRARLAELGETAVLVALPVEAQLWLARARLCSTSRYERAAALSTLESLAKSARKPIALVAIRLALRHVDGSGPRIEAVELDRVGGVLKHLPNASERAILTARLAARVRLLAAERSAEPGRAERVERLLEATPHAEPDPGRVALVALQSGDVDSARRNLESALDALGPERPLSRPAWSAVRLGLVSGRAELRRLGARLGERALARTPYAPPYSLAELAARAAEVGERALEARALSEAVRLREPGALAQWADERRRAGWEAYACGEHAAALEALREARTVLRFDPAPAARPPH